MPKSLTMEQAKAGVLALIKQGSSVEDACKSVSRTRKAYENWRSADKEFAAAVDEARERRNKAAAKGKDGDLYNLSFAQWRKRFLGLDTYPHQQLWIDVLEGREPTLMHPSVRYEPAETGQRNRILINTPPFHAKSATITQQWVTYMLCMNPALRIMIVGKTAEAAAKHLYAVRQYLTDPNYVELQSAYGPADGFKPQRGEGRWTNFLIYLAGRNLDAADKAAKDPSVQAVGIGGAIYGSRCDLIILDDAVDDTNWSSYEKQFDWLTRTVQSRVYDGKLILVGTRIKPMDLYAHLLNGDNYMSGKTPWTYLAQPAVFEYAEDPKDWKTLWPRSSTPMDEGAGAPDEDGLYPAWGGERLSGIRSSLAPGTWALVYQQEQVSEDMTFHPVCVWGSVDKRRQPGILRPGELGGRRAGMEGMHVVLSIDPAGTGEAFMLVYAVDRQTRERWVLQAWMGSNTKLSWYADMIEQIVPEYGVSDLVIERQGYSNWLYQDERIVNYCRQRGVRISPHYTGQGNKVDPDFGVASLAGLFGGLTRRENAGNQDHDGENIIHLPNPDKSPGIKALVDQLLTWVPGKSGSKLRQDGPMALWFAEMRVRNVLFGGGEGGGPQQFVKTNRFLSARARSRRSVRPSLFTH
jgi:hypothetical protein